MAKAAELKVIEPPAKAALAEALEAIQAMDREISSHEAERLKLEADRSAFADLEAKEMESGKPASYEERRAAELRSKGAVGKLTALGVKANEVVQKRNAILRSLPALKAAAAIEEAEGLASELEASLRAARATSAKIRGLRLALIDSAHLEHRKASMNVPDDHAAQILGPQDHAAVVAAQADWNSKL